MHDAISNNNRFVGLLRRVSLGAAILVLLGFTQWFSPPHVDLWWQTVLQFLHAPLFGVIAIALLAMTPSAWRWRKRLFLVLATVFVLSLLSEAAQIPLASRDASLDDIVNDWLGALAFVAAAAALSPSFHVPPGRGRYLVLFAAILMIIPLRPLTSVSLAYWDRYQQLPSIVPLQSRKLRLFLEPDNAQILSRTEANDQLSTEVRFGDTGSSSIRFDDPWSDWRAYDAIVLDVENLGSEQLPLTLRIHDEAHLRGDQPHADRFNQRISLAPGRQLIRLALDDVKSAPAGRDMQMAKIDGVVLFGSDKEAGAHFIIHDIRLE